jgi:ribosomal protein S18 acetylase RimI-like enzyme
MIRLLKESDREEIEKIISSINTFSSEEKKVALELIDIFLSQPLQKDYVVEVITDELADNKIAGYTCYGLTPMTVSTYDLYWIVVASDSQNKGFGKRLIEYAENNCRSKGGKLLVVETSSRADYAPTRSFYEKKGYQLEAKIRDFYRAGDDKIIYTKRL